jgi:hypothetical protein
MFGKLLLIISVIVLAGLLGLGAYYFVKLWDPTPPHPPTQAELAKLESDHAAGGEGRNRGVGPSPPRL